ncbi:hypothetical protein [Clostridium sp. 001]|uniref:hypothetical protein n=1 Tax=Clostridium sp. 001 TaxID=1970093 RepID=UPI001C2C317A|nr:hypothetical protein [Clostridium sp. 001]QXE19043.1 hypothetical protein B5S50_09465 [Clostridium sp. 001]
MICRLKYMDEEGEFQFKDFQTKQEMDAFVVKNDLKNKWHETEQLSMIPSKNETDFNKGKSVL